MNLTIENAPVTVRFSHLATGDAFLMENAPDAGFTPGSLYLVLTSSCAMRVEDGVTVKMASNPVVVRVKITSVTVEQQR